MSAPIPLIALSLALFAAPAFGNDAAFEPVICEGVFGPESSEALLIETYGADNVVTGMVPGPEGMEYLASTVFPDDPERVMEFAWFDEEKREYLSSVELSPSQITPTGLRLGLTVAEVEELNGAPYNIGGFWWDYGGGAWFETGKLVNPDGGCGVWIRFDTDMENPANVDVTPISGEVTVPSSEPLLHELDFRVNRLSLGYPWPEELPQPEYAD